jgi:hypothetical protein
MFQFLAAACRGAQLADHHAGGQVGLAHGLRQGRPLPSMTASVAMTVSPAPLTS